MASGQGNRSKGKSTGRRSPTGKSQSRAASGKGKSATASRAVRQSEPMDLAIRNEIILIGVLALAVFLFLCNFGIVGVVGDLVSDAMFGVLGLISYVAPALFFLAAAFGISNIGNSIAARKLVAAFILFLLIGMACDLFTGAWSKDSLYNVKELFERCSKNHNGGGVIGGTLAFVSYHFLSMVGTVLLMFVLTVICIVIITEKSVMRGVKSGGQRVYERTREDVYNRRERAQRRREEQEQLRREREEERRLKKEAEENEKILRMDKKVSGVMIDPVLISKKDKKAVSQVRDDIHEIVINLDRPDVKEAEVMAEKASGDGLPPEFDNIRITSAYYPEPDGGDRYGRDEEAQGTGNGSQDRFAARAWYASLSGAGRDNGKNHAGVVQENGNSGSGKDAAGTGYGSLNRTSRDNSKGRADVSAGENSRTAGDTRATGSRKRARRNPFMDSDEMQEVIFDAEEEDLKEPIFGFAREGEKETFFGVAEEEKEGLAYGNAGERMKDPAYFIARERTGEAFSISDEGVGGQVFGAAREETNESSHGNEGGGVGESVLGAVGERGREQAYGNAGKSAGEPAFGNAREEISEAFFGNAGEEAGEPAYGNAGDGAGESAYGNAGEEAGEQAYGNAGEEAGELAYGNAEEGADELAYGNAGDGLEELTFGISEGDVKELYFDAGEDYSEQAGAPGKAGVLEKEEISAPAEMIEAEMSGRAASSAGNARVRPVARLAEETEAAAGNRAAMPDMGQGKMAAQALPQKNYIKPSLDLLEKGKNTGNGDSAMQLKQTAMHLQKTLETFGVKVTITDISQGPTVTRYELQPAQGVKVSKIVGLADDIKLNLAATDIRIEAPIPGKAAVGIEVPNKENSVVALRELLESKEFQEFSSNLAFAVGKDIGGKTVVADIARMPHMLIAGSTGSGKSVCINTLIMSILYKAHPDDVKLIMVDPKVVELSVYNGIPHLMIPVVTDPKKAAAALHWGVAEMTDRYKKFADLNVRDLKGYNKAVEAMKQRGEEAPAKMPQIVIIVDELADLMMVSPGEVEESICRLAQLARAAGIHLIIATQRPSVDVITGLIKANMPSRVAFAVSSGVDSRTILDMNGAEKLLGKGDMLFYPQGYPKPARVQGAFVSDSEVSDVVDFLKNQAIGNVYSADVEAQIKTMGASPAGGGSGSEEGSYDQYFVDAGRFIIEKDKASIGMLQRMFKIGFNRAARIMDQLSEAGVVGEEEGTKPRKILMSMDEFEQFVEESI